MQNTLIPIVIEDSSALSWKDREAIVIAVATVNPHLDIHALIRQIGKCPAEREWECCGLWTLWIPHDLPTLTVQEIKELAKLESKLAVLYRKSAKLSSGVENEIAQASIKIVNNHIANYTGKRAACQANYLKGELLRLQSEGASGAWISPTDVDLLSWYFGVEERISKGTNRYRPSRYINYIKRYITFAVPHPPLTIAAEGNHVLVLDDMERTRMLAGIVD